MSFIDVFARIVFVLLIAIVVAVFVVLGMMPGPIARKRGRPWAGSTGLAAIHTDHVKAAHVIRHRPRS